MPVKNEPLQKTYVYSQVKVQTDIIEVTKSYQTVKEPEQIIQRSPVKRYKYLK